MVLMDDASAGGVIKVVAGRDSGAISGISKNLLISFYVSDLKPNLQRELLVAKPTSLGDAFSFARVTEARLEDQGTIVLTAKVTAISKPTTTYFVSPRLDNPKSPLLPTPPKGGVATGATPLPIKWISPAERQERLSKGLCFNCDKQWVRGHKCEGKFLLLMAEDADDGDHIEHEDAMESGDISILNSLVGHGSPRSLQLWGVLGSGKVHVLIDNGSTHNFVQPGVVERMQLPIIGTKPFKVYIGSGETLLCKNMCARFLINIQGLRMDVDLFVLPMKGPDIVLGIQWLQKLGKVTHDYSEQTMEFTWLDRVYVLKGDDALRMKRISLHHMRALLESEDIYGVYELYNLDYDAGGNDTTVEAPALVHPDIEQLLKKFETIFQVPSTLPPHRSIDHRIHLFPNTKPVNVRPYRYPHYQKGEMEKLVNEMLSQGTIRVSHSPFSSPVLLVKKKDGSYRFCVDYRALNAVTVKDKFPIPTADEMFDELGGVVIFTKLDLRAGYHQIRVHDRDVYKTAFRTHDGHYEFLVMPFGLTNAPSTFQATMNRLFSSYLRKFDHKFYVKKMKCVFGAATLEYLGHIISNRGVEVDPKKVSAVSEWPIPMSQRQVRGFLGLAGYYRRFIKDYATLAAPLSDLLQKNGFKWGGPEDAAFSALKDRLTHAPILCLPNFEDTFVIEADASGVGIGAVLLQNGRPLGYFSRKLGPRMRVAATYQKELFAIVEAVYKWRQYLLGRRFTIRTDHRSIKELMQQVIQTSLQPKYVRKLLGFDFDIEYKTGASNLVADALSRVFEEDDEVTLAFMSLSRPIVGLLDDLKHENATFDELCQIHRRMDQGETLDGFHREHWLAALFYWKGMRRSIEEFIKKCLVFQQTKYSTQASGGLLQHLPIPTAVWEDVSMDFITGMPIFKGLTIILVVVDRFTKYAHFGTLPTSFNASKVAELFIDMVVKHHGFPKTIVSDRDPIFTEVVNRRLEQYLRAMVLDLPQQWPCMVVYPHPLFHILLALLRWRQLMNYWLRGMCCMEMQANRSRREVEFNVGDKVLVKLQPYRQITLARRLSNKLAKRYYGSFEILERVGKVAYCLGLPPTSKIHPVFHVLFFKPFIGEGIVSVTNLPEEDREGQPVDQPLAVCATRDILHNGESSHQILVQWRDCSPEEATWEDLSEFQSTYPYYQLEDKLNFEGEESVTPVLQPVGRPIRIKSKPVDDDGCGMLMKKRKAY
ncbi:ty3-gypsy retrotransposon protein [Tanacetum coccineum]